MKNIIIPLAVLFYAPLLWSQAFSPEKLDTYINQKAYTAAEEYLQNYISTNIDKLEEEPLVWYYQGKVYSHLYFQAIGEMTFWDEEQYFGHRPILEKSVAGYQKSFKFGSEILQKNSLKQLEGISQFMKNIAKKAYNEGNYQQFYYDTQSAALCHWYVYESTSNTLQQFPLDTLLIYLAAHAASLTNHKQEAISWYAELIDAGANDAYIYKNVSKLYWGLGDTTNAINVVNYGLLMNPESKPLFYVKLDLLLQMHLYDELIKECKRGLSRFPLDRAELYFIMGNAYDKKYLKELDKGHAQLNQWYQLAEDAYSKANDLSPTTYDYVYNLATLYYNRAVRLSSANLKSPTVQAEYTIAVQKAELALTKTHDLNKSEAVEVALADIYSKTKELVKLKPADEGNRN